MKVRLIIFFVTVVISNLTHSQCDPSVPVFIADLTGGPDSVWVSPNVSRDGHCCGVTGANNCINFIITLDPGAAGISFNVISGAMPGGALFYQVNCGPAIAIGDPICLVGVGPHNITFCKPGNN
ncbi:MAG: hypothetical protein JKY54_06680, partial [Flavobacteriales bacterium]|nr:hypothetical protein [Flavobacteriales bacterium]